MSRPKKKWIHVNQAVIKSNRKTGAREPVITCKTYDSNSYGHTVVIYDNDGKEVARIVYRPDKPLPCGATVWVETSNKVEVRNDYQGSGAEGDQRSLRSGCRAASA